MRVSDSSNIHTAELPGGKQEKTLSIFSYFGYMFAQAVPLLSCAQNPTKHQV